MSEILIGALVLAAIPLCLWGSLRFRSIFFAYLFVFIPGYLLIFRELYFKIYGTSALVVDLPDNVKVIKEITWLYVLACFLLWRYLTKQRINIRRELFLPIVLFCGYEGLQAIRGLAAIGLKGELLAVRENLLYVPAVFMAVTLIRSQADLQTLTRRYAYLMLAAATYAFAQMAFQMESVAYLMNTEHEARQYMYSSFFSDYNVLGWFSGTVLGLILPQRRAFERTKWLYYSATFLAIFWMIASQSRTAIVALIVVGGIWAVRSRMNIKKAMGVGLLVVIFAGAAVWFIAPEALSSHRLLSAGVTDVRFLVVWPSLWVRFLEHPLIGHGLGLFGTETLAPDWVPDQPDEYAFTDNYYFVLALTGGIIALVLFFFLLSRVFRKLNQFGRHSTIPSVRDFATGVQLALVVTLVYCLISNYPQSFPESVHIWFLVGTAAALTNIVEKVTRDLSAESFSVARPLPARPPWPVDPSCPAS